MSEIQPPLDPELPMSGGGTAEPTVPGAALEAPVERVGRGIAVALLAVLVAGAIAVAVWNLGYVASITSLLLAAGAAYGYTWAAGAPPRQGLVPLLLLIVMGVVGVFFAFVAWDALQYFDQQTAELTAAGYTRGSFVGEAVTDTEVLGSYAGDFAMYVLFAALGTFGTLRMLLRRR